MNETDYTVTQKEAAEFLNVSTKSISRYRKRGLPHKLILNPVAGKQEVRFRYADLERWHEGRQLLATHGRDGEESAGEGRLGSTARPAAPREPGYLDDLLHAYREQIEILRDQLEDMRGQLARRDRQIDDLMRLMVGLQLEYKPLPAVRAAEEDDRSSHASPDPEADGLFQRVIVPANTLASAAPTMVVAGEPPPTPAAEPVGEKKVYSQEQIAEAIRHLRRKGKSYEEIARGLNQIQAATLSGQPLWTVTEVQALLPPLVANDIGTLDEQI